MSLRQTTITVLWICALPVLVALVGTAVFAATTVEEINLRQEDAGDLKAVQGMARQWDAQIAEWRRERANPATPQARRTLLENQERELLQKKTEAVQEVAEAKRRSYDVAHIFNSVRRTISNAWDGPAAGEIRMRANAQVDRLEKSYTRAINLSEPNYVTTNAVLQRLKVILQLTRGRTDEVRASSFEPSTDP